MCTSQKLRNLVSYVLVFIPVLLFNQHYIRSSIFCVHGLCLKKRSQPRYTQHFYAFFSLKRIYLRLNYLLTSNSVPLNKGLSPERLSATRTYHTALQSNVSSGSSCRPLNTEAWFRSQMSTCGICDGLSGTGTIFLQGLHSFTQSV